MPEVTALMNHAKERIKQSFNISTKDRLLKMIMEIIERRWVNQMDHPLYGAALYLNPGKNFPLVKDNDDATVGQLRGCFIEVLERIIPDVETQIKINRQVIEYEEQREDAFSNKLAKEGYDKMNPLDWWRSYGGRAIELQRLAKCIVSLCASSSGCERCWSTFNHMHTKKRNRLLHKRLNDIVFVSYNRKMRIRFQLMREKAGKKYDPLVIEEFNWDNEWADSLHVSVPGARGSDAVDALTWQHIDEATGVSEALQGRNLPRRCAATAQYAYSRRQRNVHATSTAAAADDDEEEDEVEAEDPHDNAEVSDCEDGNVPATEEDNAANHDEFDDGF